MLAADGGATSVNYSGCYRAAGWEGALSDGGQTERNNDFTRLCRLCISVQDPADMLPIFSEQSESLEEKIENVTRIEVRSDDGLPSNVCVSCLQNLDAAYRFIEQAVAGDNTLRQRLMLVKVEQPCNESEVGSVLADSDNDHHFDPLLVNVDPNDFQDDENWSNNYLRNEADPLTLADNLSMPSTSWAHAGAKKPRTSRKPRKSIAPDGVKRKRGRPRKNPEAVAEPKRTERSYELIDFDDATEVESVNDDRSDDEWVPDSEDAPRPKSQAEAAVNSVDNVPAVADEKVNVHPVAGLKPAKRGRPRKVLAIDFIGQEGNEPKKEKEGESPHACPTCGKLFAKRANLINHYRTHTGEKPFGCQHCGNSFADRSTLRQHVMTHDRVKPFQCDLCSAKFTRKQSWRNHMLVHNGIKEYRCDTCDRRFTLKEGLREHTRSHGVGMRHSCTVCGKSFAKKWRLKAHAKIHRLTDTQVYKCDLCERVFSSAEDLSEHTEMSHSNPRRFPCKLCPKAFTDRSSLTVHQRRHTGERPFVCTDCGKTFAKSSVYHIHRRTHTGEKPYSCDHCTEMFASSAARNIHARRHGPEAPLAVGLM